jgi:stage IV sporulation protein FB
VFEFRLLGIPVTVQSWFFLTAALIGPRDLAGLAMWVPIVFLGVLAHELGHAWAVRRMGGAPAIELHGFGGATTWSGSRGLKPLRRIGVSAAGPGVGIAIGLSALALSTFGTPSHSVGAQLLANATWVNLGWGVLNLLPVLPLDGGVIVASAAEAAFGTRGVRVARIVSLAACAALCAAALAAGWLWSAILAAALGLANLQAVRASRARQAPHDPFDSDRADR